MIIIGVTHLDEFVGPTAAASTNSDVLSFRDGVHWVHSNLPKNSLFLRASSYILLFSSMFFLHEDRLLILWFTA